MIGSRTGLFVAGTGGAAIPSPARIALILLVALVVPPLVYDFWLPYWEHADQDLVLAYNALLLADGKAQQYFDHPGYGYFLLLTGWYRALHGLGLLSLDRISALPPLADAAAYDAAWRELILAGRALSMTIGGAAVALFCATVDRLIGGRLAGNRRIVLLVGLGLVLSMGLNQQIRQMRTDFLSGSFVLAALSCGLLAARCHARAAGGADVARVLGLLFLTGLFAALSLVTKIQALFLCLSIPVLLVAMGEGAPQGSPRAPWAAAGAVVVAALALMVPAGQTLLPEIGATSCSVHSYKPIGFHLSGLYQTGFALWAVGGVLVYARLWRVPASTTVAALGAVAGGFALGVLALWIVWAPCNATAVANPLEHMSVFSTWKHGELNAESTVLSRGLASIVWDGVVRTLSMRTVVLHPDRVPQTVIVEWWVIAGIVVAWRSGLRPLALRAGLFLGLAWGIEAIFMLRGFQRAYGIYTEPLVLFAAAFLAVPLLDRLPERRRWLLPLSVGLFLVASQIWPVTSAIRRAPDPELPCELTRTFYLSGLEGFPVCAPR